MYTEEVYILMLSIHGLVRGNDLELGRDADTGGQVTYVVELARALGRHPAVRQVDLLTRIIDDPSVSHNYAQEEEKIGQNARIIRLPFGPRKYLRKEVLWKYLDNLVDRCLHFLRNQKRLPDLIHSHYADAGYVGLQLSQLLGIPLAHTGHSLGRCKMQRFIEAGRKPRSLERQFNFAKRIGVEEDVLSHASIIVTSTRQEIVNQYGIYHNFEPKRAHVIAPGTDTSRFSPPGRRKISPTVVQMIDRFFENPEKPIILAISRPDMRKNLHTLLQAFGEDADLNNTSNLVIIAGNRDDIQSMDEAQQQVFSQLLYSLDRYDLWGKVALPKHHSCDDIPDLFRLAARRKGVFINPAITEPFGLTLIEAAASGLPIVATEDGGPMDIIGNCKNGLLINPFDTTAIANALKSVLSDRKSWRQWARNGVNGVKNHYTWSGHVAKYLKIVQGILHKDRKRIRRQQAAIVRDRKSLLPLARKVLISDIDNTLIGQKEGLENLKNWLSAHSGEVAFGVATGRSLESAIRILKEWHVPMPDVIISSVGTEIHYGPDIRQDTGWTRHIYYKWRREALIEALENLPGIKLQSPEHQKEFKISYNVKSFSMPSMESIAAYLAQLNLHANLIYSHGAYLDVLPGRASKGQAIRYIAYKWGLPLNAFLVAGDSGNDVEMMIGDTLGVVVGNHSPEIKALRGLHQVYFANAHNAEAILEGITHYQFGEIRPSSQDI